MFENTPFVLLLIVILVIALTLAIAWRREDAADRKKSVAAADLKWRSEEIVRKAEKVGPLIYTNKVAGTTAFCTVFDFDQSAVEPGGPNLWKAVGLVKVPTTFFFCDPDDPARTQMHIVASESEFRLCVEKLVEKWTGFSKSVVDRTSYSHAASLLVRKNRRLHIPFVDQKDVSITEAERLSEFYGPPRKFAEAVEYLLQ